MAPIAASLYAAAGRGWLAVVRAADRALDVGRWAFAFVLPVPRGALHPIGAFFHPSDVATLPSAAAERAADTNALLLVVAVSSLHPGCVELLKHIEHAGPALAAAGTPYVRCVVDVTARGPEGEVPAALVDAAALPAVAVYAPAAAAAGGDRRLQLIATAEGISRETTLEALLEECAARAGRSITWPANAADSIAASPAPAGTEADPAVD